MLINGIIVDNANHYLKFKDEITVYCNELQKSLTLLPEKNVEFSILYEDNDLIVINKPAGLVVHPGAGNHCGTLVNGLVHHSNGNLSDGSEEFRPGIVHRIDKNTSGILVVAKNNHSHMLLSEQFRIHSIKRKYICFCYSVPHNKNGIIKTLIGRDKNNRLKMAVVSNGGKEAISIYRTLETFSDCVSKIECELHTGRTHQIRVHMSHIGHSLIGDSLYKIKNYAISKDIVDTVNNFPRQALHAYFLEFFHPKTNEKMQFEIEPPVDMNILYTKLKKAHSSSTAFEMPS